MEPLRSAPFTPLRTKLPGTRGGPLCRTRTASWPCGLRSARGSWLCPSRFLLRAAARLCLPRLAERTRGPCALGHGRAQRIVERTELALRVDEHVPLGLRVVVEARQADQVLNGVAARVVD